MNSELRVVPRRGDDQRESQQPYYKPLVRVVRNKGTLRLFCLPLTRRAELSWAENQQRKRVSWTLVLINQLRQLAVSRQGEKAKGTWSPVESEKIVEEFFFPFLFLHNNNKQRRQIYFCALYPFEYLSRYWGIHTPNRLNYPSNPAASYIYVCV